MAPEIIYLHAEYKPMLSILNVVLDLSKCFQNNDSRAANEPNYIDIEEDSIKFRCADSTIIFHFQQVQLFPASCRGLRWSSPFELHMSLQVKVIQGAGLSVERKNGIIQRVEEVEGVNHQDEVISEIQLCPHSCFCAGCGRPIFSPNSVFKRVLPLPSENWSDFADIWFCHNHSTEIPEETTAETHDDGSAAATPSMLATPPPPPQQQVLEKAESHQQQKQSSEVKKGAPQRQLPSQENLAVQQQLEDNATEDQGTELTGKSEHKQKQSAVQKETYQPPATKQEQETQHRKQQCQAKQRETQHRKQQCRATQRETQHSQQQCQAKQREAKGQPPTKQPETRPQHSAEVKKGAQQNQQRRQQKPDEKEKSQQLMNGNGSQQNHRQQQRGTGEKTEAHQQQHHGHHHGQWPRSLSPRQGDCLVSSLYILVRSGQVCSATVGVTPQTQHIVCKRCGNFIGFVKEKGQSGSSEDPTSDREDVYKLYLHALKFPTLESSGRQAAGTLPLHKVPDSNMSEGLVEDFLCRLFRDQSRLFTSFRFIIQSSHEEHTDSRPIVLLVWLLDQNVEVLSADCSLPDSPMHTHHCHVAHKHVLKFLYKASFLSATESRQSSAERSVFKVWERDNTVHGLSLPYPLCKQLLSLLITSTTRLPASQRCLNTFHVGYLCKRQPAQVS